MNQEIMEYIRANRDMYTREAINQELLDAGHSPEDIAAGWQALEEEDALAQPTAPAPRRRIGGLVALWFLVVLVGFVLVALTDLRFAFSSFGPNGQDIRNAATAIISIGSLIVLVGLLVATILLLRRDWPVGRVTAVVFVTAFVWYTIVLGTCLYAPTVLG